MINVAVIIITIIIVIDIIIFIYSWIEISHCGAKEDKINLSSQELNPVGVSMRRSIILIHGYIGSPLDFKPLKQELANRGFRVVIPTIPGQTKECFAYKRGSYTPEFYIDWITDIIQGESKRFDKKPFLVGSSMGGTLSVIMASKGTVDKIVLLSPFFGLRFANQLICKLSQVLRWLVPIVPRFIRGMINDQNGYKEYIPGSFLVSLSSFNQLVKLAILARKCVQKISIPTLIIASPNDKVASFPATKQLFSLRENAKINEFPRSNHILLYDYDREEVAKLIVKFLSGL